MRDACMAVRDNSRQDVKGAGGGGVGDALPGVGPLAMMFVPFWGQDRDDKVLTSCGL